MRTLARFVTNAHKYNYHCMDRHFCQLWRFSPLSYQGFLKVTVFRMDGEHAEVMDIVSDTFDMPAETMFLVFDDVADDKITSTLRQN